MSNSLRVAWVKPVILALHNPLVSLPNPPPLQISDYTTSSTTPPHTVLILSDSRHRIQAQVSPSALAAHSTPLSSLRGAIITLTHYILSYVLAPPGLPGSPLAPGDEFVLQVQSFDVVGSGGSGEVGHPIHCMRDSEVQRAMQSVKDIALDSRRALVTAHSSSLFPHFTPRTQHSMPPPEATLPKPAFPAISAELAQWEAPSAGAYLLQYHVPPQAQAILDELEPKGPAVQAEVEEAGDLLPSQWSSSREEEEKAIFSQYSPARIRLVHAAPRALGPAPSAAPLPLISSLQYSPQRLLQHHPVEAAPELPRLEEGGPPSSPPQSPAPPSPQQEEFYATQAPLSLISPPLSPSSLSSLGPDEGREDAVEEEKAGREPEEDSTAASSLSQHNLPLSTFEVDAMAEDADDHVPLYALASQQQGAMTHADDVSKAAASPSQMPNSHSADSSADDGDDVPLLELVADPSPPMAEPMTQAPMSQALSQLSQDDASPASPLPSSVPSSSSLSRGIELTLPPPSFPSSMPPLSPGTPSPQKTSSSASQRRRPSPARSPERRPPSPLPRATIEVKREQKKEDEEGAGDEGDDGQQFDPSSIQQRQQRRVQELLSERQGRVGNGDGGGAQKRSRMAGADGDGAVRGDGASDKRQRTVRFSDEAGKGREERKEREGRGAVRRLSERLVVSKAEVEQLAREPRAAYTPWSDEDYQLIVSHWRSRAAP